MTYSQQHSTAQHSTAQHSTAHSFLNSKKQNSKKSIALINFKALFMLQKINDINYLIKIFKCIIFKTSINLIKRKIILEVNSKNTIYNKIKEFSFMNKKFLSIFIAIMSLSLIAIVGCNQKTKSQINQDDVETNQQIFQVSQNDNQDEDDNQDDVETNKYQS